MKQLVVPYCENLDFGVCAEARIEEFGWRKNDYMPKTVFRLCWNHSGMAVEAVSYETRLRMEADTDGRDVWHDSCMEFFFGPAEPERRPPLPPVLESVNHRTIGIPLRKEDHRAGLLHRHKSPELPRYRIVVLGAVTRQRHIPATARAQQPGSLRERAAAGRATLGIEQAEYLVSIIHKSTFQVKDGLIDIRQPPSAYRSRKSGPFFRDRSCRFRNPYIRTAGAD